MFLTTIALLILLLFAAPIFITGKQAKKNAYQWWHVPCFALLYVMVVCIIFHLFDVPFWPGFNLLYEGYLVEVAYVLLAAAIWLVVSRFLRKPAVHKELIKWFRIGFGGHSEEGDKLLPFPYLIDDHGTVCTKVGKPFYQKMLGGIIVMVAVVYALFFALMGLFGFDFYLKSSFGLLGLLPLIDYYHYLKAEVPEEKNKQTSQGGGSELPPSDMEKLWLQYVELFANYSVAWKRKFHQDKKSKKDNQATVEYLLKGFMGTESTQEFCGIFENCCLVDAFNYLEPLFDWVEENGRLVLLVVDIPDHFLTSDIKSFQQEVAKKIREIIGKTNSLKVYDEYSPDTDLNTSIVVASLSVLATRNVDVEWMKRIGLVAVINLFDKSISNLYECHKFSYLLQSVNKQYQMLFITPHLKDVEPTIKNIWLTGAQTNEKKMIEYPHGYHQFFIGYHIEDYLDRFSQIMKVLPAEPFSAGSEMIPIALSYKEGDKDKAITPVHFFDLAYSNIIEGVEELGKSYENDIMPVWKEDIMKHVHTHLLPLENVPDSQVFSVIYDQANNAPAAYSKWIHLGHQENFSIVLSKPYLFRDYFNANHAFFVSAPFPALHPHLSKSRITLAVILLELLQKSEVSEQQLRILLQGYYDSETIDCVPEIVEQLFKTYFSGDLAGRLKARQTIVFDGSQYQHQIYYQLDYSDNVRLSYLDRISVADESGNVLFVINKDLLFQNFDKGQTHSFSGKPYEILSFDSNNKVLKVKAVNTKAVNVSFYKPVQSVAIGKERRIIEEMKRHGIWKHPITEQELSLDIEGFETSLTVKVDKWYEFCHYHLHSAFFDASLLKERKYNNGRVLKVTFHYLNKEEYLQRKDDIRKSLQILFYEAMQSIFPHHAQYLIISSLGEGDPDLPWIFNKFDCDDKDENNAISFYFIEDAHIDLGLLGALSNGDNFGVGYLFKYLFDYLIWLTEDDSVSAEGYDEFKVGKSAEKLSFLKYGRDKLPVYFDIDLLINFIRDFFCDEEVRPKLFQGVSERTKRQEVYGTCDFCRKKMKNGEMQRLSDGRMRCPDCSVDAIDTIPQFDKLCNIARDLFKQHLNIDFSQIKHEKKLIPAVELHKEWGTPLPITNGYDTRKIIGLASSKNDTIYIEDGRKPMDTLGIIIHEMTHIWQYHAPEFAPFLNDKNWREGLAVWTDLFLTEKYGATNTDENRASWLARTDEYGIGLKQIMKLCPNDPYGYIHKNQRSGA